MKTARYLAFVFAAQVLAFGTFAQTAKKAPTRQKQSEEKEGSFSQFGHDSEESTDKQKASESDHKPAKGMISRDDEEHKKGGKGDKKKKVRGK